jgi:phosphatidylglycerol:prolipoprotein diacylglycerol transferase
MELLVIPYPVVDPVAFRLGPLSVKWYGLAYIAGLLLGWLYIKQLLGRPGLWTGDRPPLEPQKVDDLLIYMTLGVLIGGRLGYVLFYEPRHFLDNPLAIPAVWMGGMSFHGGLLGSILAIVYFARRAKAQVWSLLDLCAAAAPIGLFFGRLANFINAELVGRPTSLPWAMVFPGSDGLERHPSQLYEAFFEGLVLFAVLWWLTHRVQALRRPGMVSGAFMLGYGLARSFSELFREPDPGHILTIGPLTAGIAYSLPMIAIGLWVLREAARRSAPAPADVRRPS